MRCSGRHFPRSRSSDGLFFSCSTSSRRSCRYSNGAVSKYPPPSPPVPGPTPFKSSRYPDPGKTPGVVLPQPGGRCNVHGTPLKEDTPRRPQKRLRSLALAETQPATRTSSGRPRRPRWSPPRFHM
uniref:Uncharacterized protein n=1 Tax=Steinernema glaseri TaxID=37863 RepID=A0A1I7YKM9_9BILA